MKIGDMINVNINEHVITQGKIAEIDSERNVAVVIVPATRVEFGIRSELTDLPKEEVQTAQVIEAAPAPVSTPETTAPVGAPEGTVPVPGEPAPAAPVQTDVSSATVETPQAEPVVAPAPVPETKE